MARLRLIDGATDGAQSVHSAEALPDAEALDAYSRTVTSVAERLRSSVANLQVRRRTKTHAFLTVLHACRSEITCFQATGPRSIAFPIAFKVLLTVFAKQPLTTF